MNKFPKVLSTTEMSNSFITGVAQICVVTHDHLKTLEGFVKMGIGPWAVTKLDQKRLSNTTYMGQEVTHSMVICNAFTGSMMWEIIEPLEGGSIYYDFLEKHGEGIHHVAVSYGEMTYDETIKKFQDLGCPVIQSGVCNSFPTAYLDTEKEIKTTLEVFEVPKNLIEMMKNGSGDFPEPNFWFPAKPE